ncbi:hypothetical protein OH77DRAFT_265008 [Trametes cingulata]|nr:hypothetical protein OH77DRAFT_265008 [Trametes cingulata]
MARLHPASWILSIHLPTPVRSLFHLMTTHQGSHTRQQAAQTITVGITTPMPHQRRASSRALEGQVVQVTHRGFQQDSGR